MSSDSPNEHPAWRDYRRRRAVVYAGLVVVPAVIAALHWVGMGVLQMLCAYAVVGMLALLGATWLGSFPCPGCGDYWFRDGEADDVRFFAAWTQKTCARCGWHRFVNPRPRRKKGLPE